MRTSCVLMCIAGTVDCSGVHLCVVGQLPPWRPRHLNVIHGHAHAISPYARARPGQAWPGLARDRLLKRCRSKQ